MLYFFLIPLLLLSCSESPAPVTEERVLEIKDGVQLIVVNLYNDAGRNFGERYYAMNRNKHTVKVSITLSNAENADAHLLTDPVVIPPLRRETLGYVNQIDIAKGANWKYEWQVETVEESTK